MASGANDYAGVSAEISVVGLPWLRRLKSCSPSEGYPGFVASVFVVSMMQKYVAIGQPTRNGEYILQIGGWKLRSMVVVTTCTL